LPTVQKDLAAISDYISLTLNAPQAAFNFLDMLEKSIAKLPENPFAHRLYSPLKPVATEYRVMTVKNYLVFYTVLEGAIEIHRVVYKKRDLNKLITK
jgi:addiction module RelE/StbE family toxin